MFSKYNFKVIRTLRRRLGMTMEQLAQKSGVTYPTVAAVETNKSLPSMKTLDALAGALQFSASNLLALAERRMVQIRRAEIAESPKKNQPGMEKLKVAYFDKGKMIRTTAAAGERIHVMELHEDCHEMAYVLNGELSLRVDDNNYLLREDDTILFDGVLDHEYDMITDCEFITVHIPKDLRSIKELLDSKSVDIIKEIK
ncbi:MAG: helix-turn-helix domain-containing protein [Phycisphaerae bacterium]|nr:helix-turn-helix domain-containing protein [Phycisphaerae bacterium]